MPRLSKLCLTSSRSAPSLVAWWRRAEMKSTRPQSAASERKIDGRLLKTSAEVDVHIEGSGRVMDHLRAYGKPSLRYLLLCPFI